MLKLSYEETTLKFRETTQKNAKTRQEAMECLEAQMTIITMVGEINDTNAGRFWREHYEWIGEVYG